MKARSAVATLLAALTAVAAAPASAQRVRSTVLDTLSGAPVGRGFVVLFPTTPYGYALIGGGRQCGGGASIGHPYRARCQRVLQMPHDESRARRAHEHQAAAGVSICTCTTGAIMRNTPSSYDRTVRLFAVLVLVCSTSTMGVHEAEAQQRYVTLTGAVTNLNTQEPLPGVSVVIDDRVIATTTADGAFQVATTLIKPGSNVVTFRRLGYGQVAKLLWIADD